MDSRTRDQLLYEANRKSAGVSYLLWFFLGGLGAHRFYLGQTGTAVAQLLLTLLGWLPLVLGWAVLGIWLLVDAFLIPGMVRDENMKMINLLDGSARRDVDDHRLTAPPERFEPAPRGSLDPRVEEIRELRRR